MNVYGTLSASAGLRWHVLKARLDGSPANNVFLGWPTRHDGPCEVVDVRLGFLDRGSETLCGRISGVTDTSEWSHRVTWTCTQCLFVGSDSLGLSLYTYVAVPVGTIPNWEIFADFGG